MRNFQDSFETRKRSFISDFSICMTVHLRLSLSVCKINFELCGKTSKFLSKRCMFNFFISNLNEEESLQQVCLSKYVENKFFKSNSHKTKN